MIITYPDIKLIKKLDGYTYSKSMKGVVSSSEANEFKDLKGRLKQISENYKTKYDKEFGEFYSDVATGNPISFHGNLRRVWSGIFKGSENKQYSAQISFVINTEKECLDVGFYFGRASSFNVDSNKREKWEQELKQLGSILFKKINQDQTLKDRYNLLFDYGFKAEIRGIRVTQEDWLKNLANDPTHSSIVFNLKPSENGEIEKSTIDFYVAMVMPLISVLPESLGSAGKKYRALTPEERAKQAEQRALIGLKGEEFIMKIERVKLSKMPLEIAKGYPQHKSLISDSFGYDILSVDENGKEIFIEVKTTTYLKSEDRSKEFFISFEEVEFRRTNKLKYRLYRVYDIYGDPQLEILNWNKLSMLVKNYRVRIN